jgi:glycerol-3-phosphate dehydrogenase
VTTKIRNGALRLSAFILEFAMNDVVESILNAYQSMRPLDAEQAADSRQKISRYIESLASAGRHDAEQLTVIAWRI